MIYTHQAKTRQPARRVEGLCMPYQRQQKKLDAAAAEAKRFTTASAREDDVSLQAQVQAKTRQPVSTRRVEGLCMPYQRQRQQKKLDAAAEAKRFTTASAREDDVSLQAQVQAKTPEATIVSNIDKMVAAAAPFVVVCEPLSPKQERQELYGKVPSHATYEGAPWLFADQADTVEAASMPVIDKPVAAAAAAAASAAVPIQEGQPALAPVDQDVGGSSNGSQGPARVVFNRNEFVLESQRKREFVSGCPLGPGPKTGLASLDAVNLLIEHSKYSKWTGESVPVSEDSAAAGSTPADEFATESKRKRQFVSACPLVKAKQVATDVLRLEDAAVELPAVAAAFDEARARYQPTLAPIVEDFEDSSDDSDETFPSSGGDDDFDEQAPSGPEEAQVEQDPQEPEVVLPSLPPAARPTKSSQPRRSSRIAKLHRQAIKAGKQPNPYAVVPARKQQGRRCKNLRPKRN